MLDHRERTRRGLRFLVQGISCLLDVRKARTGRGLLDVRKARCEAAREEIGRARCEAACPSGGQGNLLLVRTGQGPAGACLTLGKQGPVRGLTIHMVRVSLPNSRPTPFSYLFESPISKLKLEACFPSVKQAPTGPCFPNVKQARN